MADDGLAYLAQERLDKAVRLFEFLTRVQKEKTKQVRDVATYVGRQGDVLWIGDLPPHPAIGGAHLRQAPDPSEPILIFDRVPRTDPPLPPDEVIDWLVPGSWLEAASEPEVRDEIVRRIPGEDGELDTIVDRREDHPGLDESIATWLDAWHAWSEDEVGQDPVRKAYRRMFRMSDLASASPEEVELVAAVGLMSWHPDNHEPVRRHLITMPCVVSFDDRSGRLTVTPDPDSNGMSIELEMLEVSRWPDRTRLQPIQVQTENFQAHLFDREEIAVILQRLANNLDPGGRYDDEATSSIDHGRGLVVSFSPALVLRRRSTQLLLRVYQEIVEQLQNSGEVPAGVLQLIEVVEDGAPATEGNDGSARVPTTSAAPLDTSYLPLPANDQQRRIVERVNTQPHTVVQGPPGTGKTHTIANLLAHLLAQGKRVLVTAQTDRALRELRQKLPSELEQLCVSVVGRDRNDLSDLKVAVDTLASRAAEHDASQTRQEITRLETRVDELRRRASKLNSELVSVRERETFLHEYGGYVGTLAALCREHSEAAEDHGWVEPLASDPTAPVPLTGAEAVEWYSLATDRAMLELEPDARRRLADPSAIPSPHDFAGLVSSEKSVAATVEPLRPMVGHVAFAPVLSLEVDTRSELGRRIEDLIELVAALSPRQEQWMAGALADVYLGRRQQWEERHETISKIAEQARIELDAIGLTTSITVTEPHNMGALEAQATTLRDHLEGGGKLRGVLGAPKAVKQARDLWAQVRVNDQPPDNPAALDRVLHYFAAKRATESLARSWPRHVEIPEASSLRDIVSWHATEVAQLGRVIELGQRLQTEEQTLKQMRIPIPRWGDLEALRTLSQVILAADATEALEAAQASLRRVEVQIADTLNHGDATDVVSDLAAAVADRSTPAYTRSFEALERLAFVRSQCSRRDELRDCFSNVAPKLPEVALTWDPAEAAARLGAIESAWQWMATGKWIDDQDTLDVALIQKKLTEAETSLRVTITQLTAQLAWARAVERLGLREQQNLKSYALAVRQMGRGTGKYAAHRREQARATLRECRSAVPAWVLPLYRIAETLTIEPDMFDVVIIDEASQAGIDAAFLMYLAPKVVVVGDDKQVSPAGVGIDRQQLIDLRRQFLAGFDHAYTWENPETSFFDQARLRSPEVITLREHFRCVPEIIGFSNRIAYEPDNVPLIPLRQYGRDRLDPIQTVYVDDGYTKGSSGNLVNPPEADRLVESILKCCADPSYGGKTMGVISLTGTAQADAIEQMLLLRMDPSEFKARGMRCGDAADFQGSERDVMFLSMVVVREPNRRYTPLTRDLYMQRFNVAVSRARDQLWVFHSITIGELTNQADMRFQLLDYCASITNRGTSGSDTDRGRVPDDVQLESVFDSMFEQHVYNQIYDRGYLVQPQYPVYGYRIDLVVTGGTGRLAIECDGDQWHGAEEYEHDLARQRELERVGWTFFRVRASSYYRNPHEALSPLWELLDQHAIYPITRHTQALEPSGPEPLHKAEASAPTRVVHEPHVARDSDGERPGPKRSVIGPEPLLAVLPPVSILSKQSAATPATDLPRYPEWEGAGIPDPRTATSDALATCMLEIIDREGPITSDRLFRIMIRAAGFSRLTTVARRPLNRALHRTRGRVDAAEYASPETPWPQNVLVTKGRTPVVVREIGPRDLYEVPLDEVAAHFELILARHRDADREELFRLLLEAYDLQRLTPKVGRYLDAAAQLRERPGPEDPATPLASPAASAGGRTERTEVAIESPAGVHQPDSTSGGDTKLSGSGSASIAVGAEGVRADPSLVELLFRIAVLQRDDPSGPSAPLLILTQSEAAHWAAVLHSAHHTGGHFCLLVQRTESALQEVEIGLLERCVEVPQASRQHGLRHADRLAYLDGLRQRHRVDDHHRGCPWRWWQEEGRPAPVDRQW